MYFYYFSNINYDAKLICVGRRPKHKVIIIFFKKTTNEYDTRTSFSERQSVDNASYIGTSIICLYGIYIVFGYRFVITMSVL